MLFASLIGWGMEVVGLLALAIIVGFIILRLVNKRAGNSWWHLFRTKAGEVGDYAATIDPAKQMKQAALDAAADLKTADEALISSDKLRTKLKRQIDSDTIQANRLRASIKKLLDDGTADNDPRVVDKAKRLRDLDKAIAENTAQAEAQEKIYANTLKSANSAADRIRKAAQEADRMQVQLDLGAETVKLQAMLQKYDPTVINSNLAKVDQYKQAAQDKIDGYTSAAKVMADRSAALVEDEGETETEDVSDVLDSIRNNGKPKTANPSTNMVSGS